MGDQEAKDAAAKQRIITHMNNDHHDSVIRYLEHYHNVSSWSAYDGRIADIDLNGLTLSCGGSKTYRIPFNPPMTSYREARERVVAMDGECLKGLGRSDITVNDFVPPTKGIYPVTFLIIATTFVAYSQRWWFAPGGPVESVLGPGFAAFSATIQPGVFWGMVLIHGSEAVWFAINKLKVHSVSPRTRLWWTWILFVFIEELIADFFSGQFAYKRFNDLVERKREEKANQKH